MAATCVRHTDLPGTSKLFADVLYNPSKTKRFYAEPPPAPDYPDSRRAAMVAALRELNGDSPSLDVLAKSGAVAVVTGQQTGLFGGPCYTIYKALSAIKRARQMSEKGRPAVAVFWLATEDHDFEEVRHYWTFTASQEPLRLSVEAEPDQRPVGGIAIPSYPLEHLGRSLAGFPFAQDAFQIAERAYRPGATMGGSFLALLKELFAPYGLLFIDPMQPAIRTLAAPLLERAHAAAKDLVERLLARGRELGEAGYHAQVHVEPGTSLFFTLENGQRISLRDGQPAPAPEGLSPNALLRPVMQDYLLPTTAYIGGPAEIAYLAQSQVLYTALGIKPPAAVPRNGFTLLDGRADRLMQRYGLTLKDLSEGEEALKQHMAAHLIPTGLTAEFQSTQALFKAKIEELRRSVVSFDPTLASALNKAQAKMLYQLAKTEAKVKRESVRRDQTAAADAAYFGNLIYPHKHLQERFYGFLPFLAKFGPGVLDEVYKALNPDCPDHVVLTV